MKFGKLMKTGAAADGSSGTSQLMVRYGQLKKQLKVMASLHGGKGAGPHGDAGGMSSDEDEGKTAAAVQRLCSSANADTSQEAAAPVDLTAEEAAFIETLNEDLQKFNAFFIDAEEDAVIRLTCLQQRLAEAQTPQQKAAVQTDIVSFHGELVLLLHWSMLNTAGITKILKKHDKLAAAASGGSTGHLLRGPYLANVLQQPFYSTDSISVLVRQVEELVPSLTSSPPAGAEAGTSDEQPVRGSSPPAIPSDSSQAQILRRTQMALGLWRELGEKASTPSTVVHPSAASPPKRRRIAEQPLPVSA